MFYDPEALYCSPPAGLSPLTTTEIMFFHLRLLLVVFEFVVRRITQIILSQIQ